MSNTVAVGVHIEPLLHLAAVTVALTIAYIGLDEVRWEYDKFRDELVAVQNLAKEKLRQNDLWSGGQSVVLSNELRKYPDWLQFQILILCFVAAVPTEKNQIGLRRFWRCLGRQKHVPMLNYFRNRFDRTTVTLLGALSILMFLYLTAVAMWEMKWFPGEWAMWLSTQTIINSWYWACAGIIIWICATVAITHRLQKIGPTCELFFKNIDDHLKVIYQDAIRKVTNSPPEAEGGDKR